jgi:hypothetical protein
MNHIFTHGFPFILTMRTVLTFTLFLQPCWATGQVRRAIPEFRRAMDCLSPDDVLWEPYTDELVQARAPQGLAPLCSASQDLWLTTAVLVYDVAIEPHMPDRVMRQFGQRQPFPVPRVFDRVSRTDHRYKILKLHYYRVVGRC